MKTKLMYLFLMLTVAVGLWSCTDLPPEGEGPLEFDPIVQGIVYDLNTGEIVQNVDVFLTLGDRTDSLTTGADGIYRFELNGSEITQRSGLLSFKKTGYESKSVDIDVNADTTLVVALQVDLSSSALITGTLRDSTSLYPLRNARVILTLPGVTDEFTTGVDGNFRMYADLIDRDSLTVTLTAVKDGFKTKTVRVTVYRGQTMNLGNVLMQIDAGSTVAQVMGRVLDNQTRNPLNNVRVTLASPIFTDSVLTSGDGSFSFTIDLRGTPSVSGTVSVSKSGYRPAAFSFNIDAGEAFSEDIVMIRDTVTGVPRDSSGGTGLAHSIALISVSRREISVYGVGGNEASIIVWEVRDSLGFPIDIDHRDTVSFSLIGTPVSGGAYVSPVTVLTNVSGRVATTINSGTVSGVMQFIATLRRDTDGHIITSTPVIITVNAGLPSQTHFTIGPDQYNFAGYDWVNRTNDILVQVGDKYSNPVKVGTAVYFNTTGGVVAASGFTDASSHATVTLYSGNPLPRLPELASNPSLFGDGTGYFRVRAYTLGENGSTVSDSVLMVMSGRSTIALDTAFSTLHLLPQQCVTVPVRISDRFGNPLSPGTEITTTVIFSPPEGTNWSVNATGLPTDPIADHLVRGPGSTDFNLYVCDGTPGGTPSRMNFSVEIKVTGANGNTFISFNGYVGP